MFAKRVLSMSWRSPFASLMGTSENNELISLYVFDNGFASRSEAESYLREMRLDTGAFAYIYFCGQWYPVNIYSYRRHTLVTREGVLYSLKEFGEKYRILAEDCAAGQIPVARRLCPDTKKWRDGICRDLQLIDDSLRVEYPYGRSGVVNPNSILWNNTVITFGLRFYKTEICIADDYHVEKIFPRYYNRRSMEFERDTISLLRAEGKKYYNPFAKTASRNEEERKEKEKKLLNRMFVPSVYR